MTTEVKRVRWWRFVTVLSITFADGSFSELLLFPDRPAGDYEYIECQMFVKCNNGGGGNASSNNDEKGAKVAISGPADDKLKKALKESEKSSQTNLTSNIVMPSDRSRLPTPITISAPDYSDDDDDDNDDYESIPQLPPTKVSAKQGKPPPPPAPRPTKPSGKTESPHPPPLLPARSTSTASSPTMENPHLQIPSASSLQGTQEAKGQKSVERLSPPKLPFRAVRPHSAECQVPIVGVISADKNTRKPHQAVVPMVGGGASSTSDGTKVFPVTASNLKEKYIAGHANKASLIAEKSPTVISQELEATCGRPDSTASSPLKLNSPLKFSAWKTVAEIPSDVDMSRLTVDQVACCVKLLGLSAQLAASFHEQSIDGMLLISLDEKILVKDFGCSSFEARKLIMFFKNGWRPNF